MQDRVQPPVAPDFESDVRPLLQAQCASCHGAVDPAGGWSVGSYLGVLGCVSPSSAPATLPPGPTAPALSALDTAPHRGLLTSAQRATLARWIADGTPEFRDGVHDPGIADPRSSAFHGNMLRATRWSAMLDPRDANACGRCHDGVASRPQGVTSSAPGAPSCTSCHDRPGGVLACSTCHGSGSVAYPPRDACFFPDDGANAGAHAVHVRPSAALAAGASCSTCHPVPGDPVIGGLHGNGSVEIVFDPSTAGSTATYDRTTKTCAGTCHDHGGARPRPAWTETTPVGCGDCHGSPPVNHFVGPCTNCHAEPNATGSALSGGPLHLNGQIDLGNGSGQCGACHGSGDSPWPSTAAHPAHQTPTLTVPLDCTSCHVVPSTVLDPVHLDGTVHVTFSGLAVARGSLPAWDGAACAGVACHGASLPNPGATPRWDDATGAQAVCGACHGAPPANHPPSPECDRADCHGPEVAIGTDGKPTISAAGLVLHVDGIIETAR